MFRRREWPTLKDAVSHRVFLLGRDRVQPVIAQRAEQALAVWCRSPVHQIAKYRTEIELIGRQRPTECQVAGAFGSGSKTDKQHVIAGRVWRRGAKLISPKPKRLPRAQFVRDEANDIGVLAWLRDVFEIAQPDLAI